MAPSPGRPRRASQELLQEAAFELFQLRGYRATSVEQIAKTAGFSRATFFNFFSSKAELFWVETDGLIASLRGFLEECLAERESAGGASAPPTLHRALLAYAETLNSAAIPWALQHYRLLEAADDLIASGASRVLGLNRLFQDYLERRDAVLASDGADSALRGAGGVAAASAGGAVATALLLSALRAWIDAGVERGRLREHLERAFEAVAPR